jgi:hypothetical protein
MPAVNDVGKPCAGEPHARIDGRELETERPDQGHEEERPDGKPPGHRGFVTYRQTTPPRQLPTLRSNLDKWLHVRRGKGESACCTGRIWIVEIFDRPGSRRHRQ